MKSRFSGSSRLFSSLIFSGLVGLLYLGCAPKGHDHSEKPSPTASPTKENPPPKENTPPKKEGDETEQENPPPKKNVLLTDEPIKTPTPGTDSKISKPKRPKKPAPSPEPIFDAAIHPERIETKLGTAGKIRIAVEFARGGQPTSISNLKFESDSVKGAATAPAADSASERQMLTCEQNNSTLDVSARIANQYYRVMGQYQIYVVKFSAVCGHDYRLQFDEESKGGQVLSIVETIERAKGRLAGEVGLEFWNERININYPARSNYYALGTVNITRGNQYEAVAHEIGHAIYELGGVGAFGLGVGTQSSVGSKVHFMDQCYSEELAYSEGWATFFASWLYLNPSDPDAHLTTIQTRRSPIQIENVPGDVCKGPASEWRVASYFWRLYDQTTTDRIRPYSFKEIWSSLTGHEVLTVRQAAALIEAHLAPTTEGKAAFSGLWRKVFLTK